MKTIVTLIASAIFLICTIAPISACPGMKKATSKKKNSLSAQIKKANAKKTKKDPLVAATDAATKTGDDAKQ